MRKKIKMIIDTNDKNYFNKVWKNIEKTELKRQILHHEITYRVCNNNLYISPISNLDGLVLNLGSGYGIWSRKLVENDNKIYIIDIDIKEYIIYKPIDIYFEKYLKNFFGFNILFKNIDLVKDNINFKTNTISYVYQRDMISVYNTYEWDHLISEIYRVLKPNGYVELVEYDFIIEHMERKQENDSLFSNIIVDHLKTVFDVNKHVYKHDILYNKVNTFFENINISITKLPLYYEDKYKGICIEDLILGFNNINQELDEILKSKTTYNFSESLEKIKNEWHKNKSYIKLYIIYAKK